MLEKGKTSEELFKALDGYKKVSLRRKVLSRLFFVLITVIALVMVYEYFKTVRTFDHLTHGMAEDTNTLVGELVGASPDMETVNKNLRSLVYSMPDLKGLHIISGQPLSIVASSVPSLVGMGRDALPFIDFDLVMSFEPEAGDRIRAMHGSEYLYVDFLGELLPGQSGGGGIDQSYVIIVLDSSDVWSHIYGALFGDVLAALFVIISISLFAYYLLQRHVFFPLEGVSKSLTNIGSGARGGSVPIYDYDEIGEMGAMLNTLFSDIDAVVASLQESEERYGLAVKAANAAIWDWDVRKNEIFWAGWSHSFFGTDSVLKLPRSVREFYDRVHPDDRPLLKKTFFAYVHEKDDFDIEFRIKLFFGGYIWAHAKAKGIFDEDGRLIRMTGSFNNVTARKKAEQQMVRAQKDAEKALEALTESEERLALALDGTSDGLWDWNIDTNEAYYSPRFLRVLGYEPDDAIAFPPTFDSFRRAVHEADRGEFEAALRSHLDNPIARPFDAEFRLKIADGGYRYFRARGGALRNAQGLAYRMAGSLSDITERRMAEEEVRVYQERFQKIIEKAADGIMTVDTNGEVEQYNHACEKIFGYDRDEVLGQNVSMLMAEDNALLHPERMAQAIEDAEHGPYEFIREVEGRRKDGSVFPVNIAVTSIEIQGRTLFTAVLRDISASKEYEEELKKAREDAEEANRKTNLILASMAEGIYGTDLDGHTTFVNPATEQILGYTQDEFFNYNSHDLFHHSHADGTPYPVEECKILDSLKNKRAVHAEDEVFWRKDGTSFPVSYSSKPIFDADGVAQGCVVTFRDITDRKRDESEIFAYQERISAIVDRAADGIITIDTHGLIEQFNHACEKIFGYKREEVIGRNVSLLVPDAHREHHDYYIRGYVETGESNVIGLGRELMARRKDGTNFPIYLAVTDIEAGGKRLFTGILRDISADKEYEENLKKARGAAEDATRAKSEFLANMSHEIRTPMNGILGTASLLGDTMLDDKQKKYVDTIAMSGDVLLRLLNDVLDYSKIEAGKFTLVPEPFESRRIFDDVYELFKGSSAEKDLVFTMNYDESIPPYLVGDQTRIRQIMTNLTSNAIKYTERGSVTVDVVLDGLKDGVAQVKMSVKDTGMGIPEDVQKSIFEKFTRVEGKVSKIAGTGLGLAICMSLVEMMGGKIGLESQEGEGSTFWFTIDLPVAAKGNVRESEQKTAHDLSARFRGNILLVEDVETNQFVVTDMLESLGCSVDVAENGKVAVDAVSRKAGHGYDLVLMDCNMPVMNGFEATELIRDHHAYSGVPIVALTANAFKEDIDRCFECGMNGFLSKPVKKQDLVGELSKWLDREDADKKAVKAKKKPAAKKAKPKASPAKKVKQTASAAALKKWKGFDPAFLDMMSGRSMEKTEKFIALTLKDAKTHKEGLEKALVDGDAIEMGESAHALKSITAQAGAHVLADLAKQLEALGKGGSIDGADKLLEALLTEYELMVAKLNSYL